MENSEIKDKLLELFYKACKEQPYGLKDAKGSGKISYIIDGMFIERADEQMAKVNDIIKSQSKFYAKKFEVDEPSGGENNSKAKEFTFNGKPSLLVCIMNRKKEIYFTPKTKSVPHFIFWSRLEAIEISLELHEMYKTISPMVSGVSSNLSLGKTIYMGSYWNSYFTVEYYEMYLGFGELGCVITKDEYQKGLDIMQENKKSYSLKILNDELNK